MPFFMDAEISSERKEESVEKEIFDLKGRLRDLEEKLKKSENRSWDILGTGKRLNLGSSRRILEDDDNHFDTSEHGNEEHAQDDKKYSDPIFPPYPPSNHGLPSRRDESTPKELIKNPLYVVCKNFLSSTLFTIICIS